MKTQQKAPEEIAAYQNAGVKMVDIIVTIIIAALFIGACAYIYKEKKKGTHCIGCPMAGNCAKAKRCSAVLKDLGQ